MTERTTVTVGDTSLNNVVDFDVINGNLYYVLDSAKNVLHHVNFVETNKIVTFTKVDDSKFADDV